MGASLEQVLADDGFVLLARHVLPMKGDRPGFHVGLHLRLVVADGALVPPNHFLPSAERCNLSLRIDLWVLRHAIAAFASHGPLSGVTTIGLDLTARSSADRGFHSQAIDLLTEAGPEVCRRLSFAISETAAIANRADATRFIEQRQPFGVRAAGLAISAAIIATVWARSATMAACPERKWPRLRRVCQLAAFSNRPQPSVQSTAPAADAPAAPSLFAPLALPARPLAPPRAAPHLR